jgi:hypothetical protein
MTWNPSPLTGRGEAFLMQPAVYEPIDSVTVCSAAVEPSAYDTESIDNKMRKRLEYEYLAMFTIDDAPRCLLQPDRA